MAKLWHKPSSRVQKLWATRCTMRWLRLLLKACFQGAWVLAIYSQIRCNMCPWKYLWQQLCRLKIARQKQVTVKHQNKLLPQRPQLQRLLFIRLLHLSLQLCKVDLPLDFQKDGILLLDMVCHLSYLLHHPKHSLMHRLLSR